MTPAASTGIHSICTAHTTMPILPNSAISTAAMMPMPRKGWPMNTLRSNQSSGVPLPYLANASGVAPAR